VNTRQAVAEQPVESLWGRGEAPRLHPAFAAISDSLIQDLPLADADLVASAAYALALARAGILDSEEGSRLAAELAAMRSDLRAGKWLPAAAEDIHTAIEAEVTRRLGPLGAKLHTGRSRNDQVATAFRIAVRERAEALHIATQGLMRALLERAAEELDTLLPGYTHWQRAQPIRLAHWLLAQFWALERDLVRLKTARDHASILPLGSGALAGNPFEIDREALARELGFLGVCENSLDAVGDRDFALEIAFACSVLAVHLSRLSEELVLWSSSEFGFVKWPDAFATGSSLMPQKKNPDLVELVRGRSAAAVGDLMSLLVLLKGLASSYHRDLQEDKPPVWRITDATLGSVSAMEAAIRAVSFDRDRMRAALSDGLLATDAADALVRAGVPFREAHRAVSEAVAIATEQGSTLRDLAARNPALVPAPLTSRDLLAETYETSVERRAAAGGTARAAVLDQLEQAWERIGETT
jgi:argininosuccinate lyase